MTGSASASNSAAVCSSSPRIASRVSASRSHAAMAGTFWGHGGYSFASAATARSCSTRSANGLITRTMAARSAALRSASWAFSLARAFSCSASSALSWASCSLCFASAALASALPFCSSDSLALSSARRYCTNVATPPPPSVSNTAAAASTWPRWRRTSFLRR
ncbi:MAG TPA: hypothetical protein VFZ65_00380 [Planctomycetota bacterium]|nr:hypothetical protein [Planctomycetota bacterium]